MRVWQRIPDNNSSMIDQVAGRSVLGLASLHGGDVVVLKWGGVTMNKNFFLRALYLGG